MTSGHINHSPIMWHYTICSKISNINKYWNSFHGLTSSPDISSTLKNPGYLSSWLERAAHTPVDSDGQSRRSLSREPLRLTVACWDITMNQPSPMLWCHQNTKETLVLDKLPYGKKKLLTRCGGRKVIGREITSIAYYVLLFCASMFLSQRFDRCA